MCVSLACLPHFARYRCAAHASLTRRRVPANRSVSEKPRRGRFTLAPERPVAANPRISSAAGKLQCRAGHAAGLALHLHLLLASVVLEAADKISERRRKQQSN